MSHLLFTMPARKTQRKKTKRKEKRTKKRTQRGSAAIITVCRILDRGRSTKDKAEGPSMVLSGPTSNFGTLARLLEKQTFKGIVDNVKHYRNRR